MKWWGSAGRFETTHMKSDLRPGGKWSMGGIGMGEPFKVSGEYRQIERPRLLVFTWLPDWQGDATESIVRFDLEENDGVTTVRLTHSGLTTESSRTSHTGEFVGNGYGNPMGILCPWKHSNTLRYSDCGRKAKLSSYEVFSSNWPFIWRSYHVFSVKRNITSFMLRYRASEPSPGS